MGIEIGLLGGFDVQKDGRLLPDAVWSRRQAAALVKLLALAPGRRLHREQVIDTLWPEHTLDEAAPKLHKAAHYARRALDEPAALSLRGDIVALLPDRDDVAVDAVEFEAAAARALRSDSVTSQLDEALRLCRGDLLPEDLYADWLDPRRVALRQLRTELLRRMERWDELLALDPTDEEATLAVMRELADHGDRHGALRRFERLSRALSHELGVAPGPELTAMRDRIVELVDASGRSVLQSGTAPETLIGRQAELSVVASILDQVATGHGQTVLLGGPAGVGKTSVLRAVVDDARARGWRTGSGVAAVVEGDWAYAPALEAIGDLCRHQPTLLDGLDDNLRAEIDRAMAGTDLQWSGEGGHQRLFVAIAELLRIAAADRGVLITIDDAHDADEATLRLVHYLARCATTERIAVVIAHRPAGRSRSFDQVRASLLSQAGASAHQLDRLDEDEARRTIENLRPELGEDAKQEIVELAEGLPFALTELARRHGESPSWERSVEATVLAGLDPTTRDILQRVAVLGAQFDTDEFVALADSSDTEAFEHLDRALACRLIEHSGTTYRFRHALIRAALTTDVAPHRSRRVHQDAARHLEALGASPARVGHHLVAAGQVTEAGPFLIRAAEREAAVGAYRDALEVLEPVQMHLEGAQRARALALRADLLFALGDPTAPIAYRQALQAAAEPDRQILRARLARAATVGGDLDTAAAALEGIAFDGGDLDPEVLLARGSLAWFRGDIDSARKITEEAHARVLAGDRHWQVLELVALQGLLAHTRGEWFDHLRVELQRTRDTPELAVAIFDGYLCPAEYLLYGPTPYADVIDLARSLRRTAQRAGALRAVAFASALLGEAALLAGDLDLAEDELRESVVLHREIAAGSGEAHSLQRLAEVHLARGDKDQATALLQKALPLARWSAISLHLLQRIYGSLILAAPDPNAARAVVDRAESTLGTEDLCPFCNIMLAVPAIKACADVGDLEHAQHHLDAAEASVSLWEGTSWQAALLEARAHLAAAGSDHHEETALRQEAARLFEQAGQPLDASRCLAADPEPSSPP